MKRRDSGASGCSHGRMSIWGIVLSC